MGGRFQDVALQPQLAYEEPDNEAHPFLGRSPAHWFLSMSCGCGGEGVPDIPRRDDMRNSGSTENTLHVERGVPFPRP